MEVLYFLVPLALLLAVGSVLAFRWATRHDQFDDLDSPAVRILNDD
ncbi:MAG: cbb3-type cytochrome oxidase assembly protein CcoS [bacterium]